MSRNYKSEYKNYQGTEIQKKRRAFRNKARRLMLQKGKVTKGDGMDVDHRKPLVKGGSNDPSNYRVTTDNNNRSFARTKHARMAKAFYGN